MRILLSRYVQRRFISQVQFEHPRGISSTVLKFKRYSGLEETPSHLEVLGEKYAVDEWTNVTPRIIEHLSRRLHLQSLHPINRLSDRVVKCIHDQFKNKRGNPLFSVHDNLSPVVSLEQNFDSLLVPTHHPSRSKSDSYYINRDWMLRAHTSAHQAELIRSGLDNFVVVGDVYRRDEIDASHYPVFHQLEGVRLLNNHQLRDINTHTNDEVQIFENGSRSNLSQERHSDIAAQIVSEELKAVLLQITKALFGQDVEYRWTECFFPFTHPSWELEIFHGGKWLEVLGCGVIEHALLERAGVRDRIGWAFGIGLDRLAMKLFQIPDIRLLWSNDTGFTSQFKDKPVDEDIVYKAFSKFPQSTKDISFWLPSTDFSSNDFYELVRDEGGDLIEQVELVDDFQHPKSGRKSHCYRIVYRSMSRTLTNEEVSVIHNAIAKRAALKLKVDVRDK